MMDISCLYVNPVQIYSNHRLLGYWPVLKYLRRLGVFGSRVYPMGSIVVALVSPLVRQSVRF